MLAFSRRVQEAVRIGENIRLTVLKINAESVRLGIKAPRNIAVDREEIFLSKRNSGGHVELPQDRPGAQLLGEVDLCADAIGGELAALAARHSPVAVLIALSWHANSAWKLSLGTDDGAEERAALVIGKLENLAVHPGFLRGWPRVDR